MAGLRLVEHGRGVDAVAPGGREQVGGAQEDRGAVLPGEGGPLGAGAFGGIDGCGDLVGAGLVVDAEDVPVVVGHHHLSGPPRPDFLAPNEQGDLDLFRGGGVEGRLERGTLWTLGSEVADRLVLGFGDREDAVTHLWIPVWLEWSGGKVTPDSRSRADILPTTGATAEPLDVDSHL